MSAEVTRTASKKTGEITGQVIVRDAGRKDGKRLVMVFGILAVPDDYLKNHYQYTIQGHRHGDAATLALHTVSGIDRDDVARGEAVAGLLRSPIWRV